eukprot:CAMPEP_0181446410 /NCGR_PEP_ID=MMETSP1110-20121109/26090_1 /TAXON_ID=174948 /ORGANISM="Symbiodinium sp., Strain CCMP421" /LENGTH=552 /DNA_ID=CAMNT_0023570487 /DNA_START=90 /DNA_END=1748 /DNA_ORIENTATION=-
MIRLIFAASLAPSLALPLRADDVHKRTEALVQSVVSKGGVGTTAVTWKDFDSMVQDNLDTVDSAAKLIKIHAGIVGGALSKAVTQSADKLWEGDLTGAVKVTSDAMAQAQHDAQTASGSFRSAARRAACVLLLILGVGCLWGVEYLLAAYAEPESILAVREREGQEQFYYFPALGWLRFVLSCMILLYNFYPWTVNDVRRREAGLPAVFASWGLLAIPLLFTLSGFCHSYSKLVGPKAQLEEDLMSSMVLRIMPWYPYYIIVLIFLSVFFFSFSAWDWTSFTGQVFLVNGAVMDHNQPTFPYFPCSWWFSNLAAYTLCWHPMHMVLKPSGDSVLWTMFVVATAVVIPSVFLEWLFFADMAIFELVQYSPAFFFGQALAVWQVNHCMLVQVQTAPQASPGKPSWTLQPMAEMPFSVRFGVTTSVLVLGVVMIFICPFDQVPLIRKECMPIFTKGGLLPIFGLLILGLCNEADPLARLAARPPLCSAGKLSLSIFMLALPVHLAVQLGFGFGGFTWTFLALLFASSIMGHFLIELPSRRLAGYLAAPLNRKAVG